MNGEPPRPSRLAGRRTLIVGGTGGIGMATARQFLGEGARVVVSGLTDDETQQAANSLGKSADFRAIRSDVADPESVARLFAEALPFLDGRLDVLVHVAGISARKHGDGPLHECSEAGWDAAMTVNARGCFLTNRAAVRAMLHQPAEPIRGAIVNVGSVLSHSPAPRYFGTCAYAASKAAVRAITLTSAARYSAERIRFNLVEPGLIATPMAGRAVNDPAIRAYLQARQPLTGNPGTPEDVAGAILYLAEPASSFLTGVVVNVDGGWCLAEGPMRLDS